MSGKVQSPRQKLFLKAMKKKFVERPVHDDTPGAVYESPPLPISSGNREIERMLSNIITRLDRIEEKIDENVYPPKSAIKPEIIRHVKKAQADIRKGKGKTYGSIDDFFQEIEA